MRIAVVGTGISGMVAARELCGEHDLIVFEAGEWIGGHTNTVDVETSDGPLAVDTGFIVFNEKTYPRFCRLMRELGVAWQASDMSFSVRCDATGLEYNGTSLDGLLAQRTNALRPAFWRMVRDIFRFYREAPAVLERDDDTTTLGEFLERGGYSSMFVEKHLIPMGAAVWSSRPETMRAFPLRFLVRFFHNHGFLQVDDRPEWLVIRGGSREYVKELVAPFRDRIHLSTPIVSVERTPLGVRLRTAAGEEATFDRVVLATHADTSLRMLADASAREREVLGAFGYQRNEALLHTDASLMPRRRRAWASWNYHVTDPASELPTVTYWMNNLQSLPGETPYLVTLNRNADVAPEKVLRSFVYHHPIYSVASVRAQERHAEIDGVDGVHFCGAYWSYGFHEDGVKSAQRVTRRIRAEVTV
jgi:predicted NAD/FAD-binding protein